MKMMLHEIGLLLGKTILVTAAVVIGFGLWELLGLPAWAQAFALIPAGYLVHKLAGERIPSVRYWLPFTLSISVLTFVFTAFLPLVPELYKTAALFVFVVIGSQLLWLRSPTDTPARPGG